MKSTRSWSQLAWSIRTIFPLLLLLASAVTGRGACNTQSIDSGDKTGTVGVALTYTITTTGNAQNYSATGLPPGLSIPNSSEPTISGTPTTSGIYSVILTVEFTGNCTRTKTVTFTISAPSFVGFRLPDLPETPTPTPTPAANNMQLMLQVGATQGSTPHPFNATLEVDAGGGTWVPYNRFIGIDDTASWITEAPLSVRELPASSPAPSPYPAPPAFSSAQLTQSPPAVYMKADPRSTRFGIFQMDTNPTSNPGDPLNSRIVRSVWPTNDSTVPNGHGGTVGTSFPGPVEHAPARFSGADYYPATSSINGPSDARNNATTIYADNDGVTRPADAIYPNRSVMTTGSSTPYDTTSTVYRPIILNRPFRNVAELGYAFRDLPWKTLDFFTDKSADAGLLDIFTINDGAQVLDQSDNVIGMAPPTVIAGSVNLNSLNIDPNTDQAPAGQAILAGAILDEIDSTTVNKTGTGATDAPVLAKNIVNARSTTPMQNASELITRGGLATTILPTAFNDNQAVKTRREVVPRAMTSVSQTRVWNVVIDVVAQSGRFKPNANNLQNDFIVEGEQHYWVHVAIDRLTGEVLDKQIEVVNE